MQELTRSGPGALPSPVRRELVPAGALWASLRSGTAGIRVLLVCCFTAWWEDSCGFTEWGFQSLLGRLLAVLFLPLEAHL